MSTPEEKLREATRKVAANRDAARAAGQDQVPGGDQTTEVQSSRAQQPPPAPQTGDGS